MMVGSITFIHDFFAVLLSTIGKLQFLSFIVIGHAICSCIFHVHIFAFQIGRRRHLLEGNKNLNRSLDHNHAPFGVIFYLYIDVGRAMYSRIFHV